MRISTFAAIAALTVAVVQGNEQQNKERLLMKACIRNPRLPFCTVPDEEPSDVQTRREFTRQDERFPGSTAGRESFADRGHRPQQVREHEKQTNTPSVM
uniref:Secreted protein n=1 Tax=Steinernema glaseri TaxID=37863 RepID=A0A1I7YNA2_9BILA